MNIFRCVGVSGGPQQSAWSPRRKCPTKGPSSSHWAAPWLMETHLSVPETRPAGQRISVFGSLPSGRHRMGLKKRIKQNTKTNTVSSVRNRDVLIHPPPPISQSSETKIKLHVPLKVFIIIHHYSTDLSPMGRTHSAAYWWQEVTCIELLVVRLCT